MPKGRKRSGGPRTDMLANPDKIIEYANCMAMSSARTAESYIHVEADDLAGAAILAAVKGQPMRYGIIDELRRTGCRNSYDRQTGRLNVYDHRREQLDESHDIGEEPDYLIRLALKRCGVLMLDCLPPRLRRVILLRYWHCLSQVEVARVFGLTVCNNGNSAPRISQLEKKACKIIAEELARRGIRSMRHVI